MAQNQNNNQNTSAMAQVVAAATGNANGPVSPVQHELMALLAKKLKRELEAEDAAAEQVAKARQANADHMIEVHKQELARQAACGHVKPRNMGTALAGQRTHRGNLVLVCQYCGKQFSHPPNRPEEAVPSHLFPDAALVGGPVQ